MTARHSKGRAVWAGITGILVWGLVSLAAAQPVATEEDTERARTLFEQGVQDGDRGRWEDAVRNFREALRLRDAPAIRYNLGAALVELRRDAEAEPELRRVADDPGAPEELRSRSRVHLEDIAERRGPVVPTPAETAAAAEPDPGTDTGGGGVFGADIPWLYVGIGAAALVLVVVVIAVVASGGPERVNGDLDPGTVVLR
jgi:hypothetical protein